MFMISIDEVKRKIPQKALESFNNIFTPAQVNSLLLTFRIKRDTSFRINTIKAAKNYIIKKAKELKFKISEIPFIENAFQASSDIDILNSELAEKGLIYLQSISSMIPAIVLSPKENERILDIAAAPGSKTTQMSAMMNNTGIIDAVELDYIRMERLKYNAKLLGAVNINFFKERGEYFYKGREKLYDRALADVPCSQEGRFSIYEKSAYNKWNEKCVLRYARLQKKLLKSAILSVKINGTVVYSTCTLNAHENEEVIDFIFKDKDFKVEIISISPAYKNIAESIEPILKFENKNFNSSISKALRILSSKRLEGFFICRLKRVG